MGEFKSREDSLEAEVKHYKSICNKLCYALLMANFHIDNCEVKQAEEVIMSAIESYVNNVD